EWGTLLGAVAKVSTHGVADIPPPCKRNLINITKKDLKALDDEADRAIKDYHKGLAAYGGEGKKDNPWLPIYNKFPINNEEYRREWALNNCEAAQGELNKIISDEMESCWKKVWKGKLPMFDSWWNVIDVDSFDIKDFKFKPSGDYNKDQEAAFKSWEAGPFKTFGPPVFCVYCARIKFDPDLSEVLPQRKTKITSLYEFMRVEHSKFDKKNKVHTYLLADDQIGLGERKQVLNRDYSIEEPLAVEFVRANNIGKHAGGPLVAAGGAALDGLKKIGEATGVLDKKTGRVDSTDTLNRIFIKPAKEMIYPFGKTTKMKPDNPRPIQCLVVIG
ncbi:hypothetical protein ACFLZN_02425, partial [Nanoarchaeota archaeon]